MTTPGRNRELPDGASPHPGIGPETGEKRIKSRFQIGGMNSQNSFPLINRLVNSGALAGVSSWHVVGHETMNQTLVCLAGGDFAVVSLDDGTCRPVGRDEREAVVKLLALTYESKESYAREELARLAPAKFNPQACLHLGAIHFRHSETPIGVAANGLCFEDGTYELTGGDMDAFHREVISDLKRGITTGVCFGSRWRYVGASSCHAADSLSSL